MRCTASSRIIVQDGIHDRFVSALVERMQALREPERRGVLEPVLDVLLG